MKTKHSKSICRRLFSTPEEFVQWLYTSYKNDILSKNADYEKFAKVLAKEIFEHCLPIKNSAEKKKFLLAYSFCDNKNGLIISEILAKHKTSCRDLEKKVNNSISEKLQLIESLLKSNHSATSDEFTSITYLLRHNLLGENITESLVSVANNNNYLKQYNIESVIDWNNYQDNFKGKHGDSKKAMLAFKEAKRI